MSNRGKKLESLLETIRSDRASLKKCLTTRLESEEIEELPRLVLVQVLSCLKANGLNQSQLLQVTSSAGGLVAEACSLAKFEDIDLINKVKNQCSQFEIGKLQVFLRAHADETKKEADRQKVIKAIFYGSWTHLDAWSTNKPNYRRLFPKLSHLLKITTKPDGVKRVEALLDNINLIRELELTGYAIGLLCLAGDLEVKLKALAENRKVIRELELTGYAIGQLCVNGDLELKLKALAENSEVIRKLELTGSAIGKFCLTGDLEVKLKALAENSEVIRELELTGSAIGQLCLTGDLEVKLKALAENSEVIRELELTGSAIGKFCLTGDLELKLKALAENSEVIRELELTGSAIGQLCLTGDLEVKLKALAENRKVIRELKLTGYKLGLVFLPAQQKIVQENLRMLSILKKMLDTNSYFDMEANTVVFPEVFSKALAGYVITSKFRINSLDFQALVNFFEEVDFEEIFIQTSGKTTKELKAYVKSLTNNKNWQYLLLTYLTGNKSVGEKQWTMLKKIISGVGRGFSPFRSNTTGHDGERIADDRNSDLADSINLEEDVIRSMDIENILRPFFVKCQVGLSDNEIESMKFFISSLDGDFSEQFLEKLLSIFSNAEDLKQFLLGEMEVSQIQALEKSLATS